MEVNRLAKHGDQAFISPMERGLLKELDALRWLAAMALPGRELEPAFDRAAAPLYVAVGGIAVATAVLFVGQGFSADPSYFRLYLLALWPWLSGILVKRLGYSRIGGASELVGLTYFMSLTVVLCTMALSAISLPFADTELSRADRLLGIDWPGMTAALTMRRTLFQILIAAYRTVEWEPAAIIVILFAAKQDKRARAFVFASAVVLALSCALYPFFTAAGPFVFYHLALTHPNGASVDPPAFGLLISSIRDGGVRHISPDMLRGLISFPSVHAASAVIFVWALYPIRWLCLAALVLNAIMAISIMTVGGHYFVDLLGGVLVAVAAIIAASRVAALLY